MADSGSGERADGDNGAMTAMAFPNKNNSEDVITKSIPKGKIGRSMNVNFVIKNNSGGDWEDVYVGIEDADFSMAKPDAIEGIMFFHLKLRKIHLNQLVLER